jgi:hypothetical protein
LVQAVVYSVVANIPRFYLPFLPFAILFAVEAIRWLVDRFLGGNRVVFAVASGLLLVSVAWPSVRAIAGVAPPEGIGDPQDPLNCIVDCDPEAASRLRQLLPKDAIVASNLPWSVGWQADRAAIPLPPTVDALPLLEDRYDLRIDALYLHPQFYIVGTPRGWAGWFQVLALPELLRGFEVAGRFENGAVLLVRSPD